MSEGRDGGRGMEGKGGRAVGRWGEITHFLHGRWDSEPVYQGLISTSLSYQTPISEKLLCDRISIECDRLCSMTVSK